MEKLAIQPLYRALVENAQDVLGVLTPQGVVVTASPALRRVLQLHPERLQGRHWVDRVHPDDRAAYRRWLDACADGDSHQSLQVRAGRPGFWRTLVMSGVRVHEDAYTDRIVFSARDATEEVAATAALAEREARFRSAFHDAPIGKVLLDAQGHILDANRSFAELVNRWASELEGLVFLELLAGSQGFDEIERGWEQLRTGETPAELPLSYDRRGRMVHLRITFALVGAEGEAFAMAQILDLTARIEAERALERNLVQLRQSHERLHDMAWMASHDLKEPLRGLVGSLQLIVRRHKDVLSETERSTAQQAVDQAKRLRARLDELETQVSAMQETAAPQEMLALDAIVDEWQDVHSPDLQSLGVALDRTELPQVRGQARLGATLQSLLDQCLAWIQSGQMRGDLRIRGSWSGGHWLIRVSALAEPLEQPQAWLEPGGSLFSLRSEAQERGADLLLEQPGEERCLSLRFRPD